MTALQIYLFIGFCSFLAVGSIRNSGEGGMKAKDWIQSILSGVFWPFLLVTAILMKIYEG